MKLVDFDIGGSTIEHPYKRAMFKLYLKKRLKGYPWLPKYFQVYIKHLTFY